MKGEVFISGVPQRKFVKPGDKVQDFHVLLTMQTRESTTESPPLELSVVLDKSGSMAGSKLKWSKRAIRKVVKHLRPQDTFHLVAYDTQVSVVFENGDLKNKPKLEAGIKNIRAGSCTNLSGGLQKGFDLLFGKMESETEKVRPIRRIFLFSDGQANVGIQQHSEMFNLVDDIVKKGITITSFGIGNDFDEKMMKGIAEHGKGKYLFLEESTITKQVSKSIHGLMDLVGTESLFRFKERYGTEISRMYGNELDSASDYQIGDLNGDNLKQILLQMNLSVPKLDAKEYEFLSFEFLYKSKKLGGEEIKINGSFKLDFSEDEEKLKEECVNVITAIKIQAVGDKNQEIMDLVDREKMDEAIKLKEEIISDLEKIEKEDETGHVTLILKNERESLEKLLEEKDNPRAIKKQLGYDKYRARALSTCCLRSGYDSDEDNWSSDDEDGASGNVNINNASRRRRSSGRMNGPILDINQVFGNGNRNRSRSPPGRGRRHSGDGQLIANTDPLYLGTRNRSTSPSSPTTPD